MTRLTDAELAERLYKRAERTALEYDPSFAEDMREAAARLSRPTPPE